jgi:hypothetical protein
MIDKDGKPGTIKKMILKDAMDGFGKSLAV